MKKFLPFLLLFFLSLPTGFSELTISNVAYNSLYSNSLAQITFEIKNEGVIVENLTNSELINISSYNVFYSPTTISPGETEHVIFEISSECVIPGTSYLFYANFTYLENLVETTLQSEEYNISVVSPINVTLFEPTLFDKTLAIQTTDTKKILYSIENIGLASLNYNMRINRDDSVFSKIISSGGYYKDTRVSVQNFSLQPTEAIVFSHTLIPIMSGVSGSYSIIITDTECEYSQEIIVLNYQIVSGTPGPGFSIITADEENNFFVLIIGLILLAIFLR